jgi:hypothetical protein
VDPGVHTEKVCVDFCNFCQKFRCGRELINPFRETLRIHSLSRDDLDRVAVEDEAIIINCEGPVCCASQTEYTKEDGGS